MVEPSNRSSISLPLRVRRNSFGSGQGGVKLASRSTARGAALTHESPGLRVSSLRGLNLVMAGLVLAIHVFAYHTGTTLDR